jgi:hypothetical protein
MPIAKRRNHGVLVGRDTEVLIEGFPRSANSFSVAAFELAQGRPTIIAHHLHAPAHVIRATRLGVPAIVLIREPEEAVLEFLLIRRELSLEQVFRGYVRFYEPLLVGTADYVVGPFDEVTQDFGSVIARVNERFERSFRLFDHTEENVAVCFSAMERYWASRIGGGPDLERFVGRPSPLRDQWKAELRREIQGPRLEALRTRARDVYRTFAGSARR